MKFALLIIGSVSCFFAFIKILDLKITKALEDLGVDYLDWSKEDQNGKKALIKRKCSDELTLLTYQLKPYLRAQTTEKGFRSFVNIYNSFTLDIENVKIHKLGINTIAIDHLESLADKISIKRSLILSELPESLVEKFNNIGKAKSFLL